MAFFDPALYDTLRQLLVTARAPDAEVRFKELDLTFRAGIPEEENGYEVDLLANGANIPVTPFNADIYVERLATWHMVECAKKPLQVRMSLLRPSLGKNTLHAEDVGRKRLASMHSMLWLFLSCCLNSQGFFW